MNHLVKTGIPGLDDIMKGGIREGASILITGPPGTGKTIFCIQFILEGAKKGESGVYITSEETVQDIRQYAKNLGFDMEKYEKNGLITLIQQSIAPRKLMSIATPLALIKSKNVKRVVLDSITLFEYTYVSGVPEFRKEILDFVLKMKEANVTLVTVSEKSVMNIDGFEYKPEDFLFEGLILLTKVRKGSSYEFCLSVMKMRGQDHSLDIFPYKIGQGGMTVFPKEIPFSLIERDIKKK